MLLQRAHFQGWQQPGWTSSRHVVPRALPALRSEAIAVPVAEGRLGELEQPSSRFVEELGGAPQEPLGLREGLGELLLPLHKLGVTLTLQDKLLPSFYPQQNALFIFNLSFFHRQNLFHCQ